MKTLLTILSICLIFAACKKSHNDDPTASFSCEALKSGLSANNEAIVANEINTASSDLMPLPATPADEYGQSQNINILVQRLSDKCGINAELLCYSCIETLPAQSEIRITFTENSTTYSRVLDISVNQQNMLIFHGMHE
jgi:hypothetical protein